MNPARAKYILTRLRESPTRFLILKARIELRKKASRGKVMRAAAKGTSFGVDYARHRAAVLDLGRGLRQGILAQCEATMGQDPSALRTLAGDFDAGHWPCLGFGNYALRTGHWHEDDFSGHDWPADYFADIDYVCADTRCDTKVPWEKSRMQWLLASALACRLDPDAASSSRRQARALELFQDWVQQNPYGVGVNWVPSMEVAIRMVNMLLSLALLEDRLEEDELDSMLACAGDHLHYLERFPETSDVEGNHYLATALGVYFLKEFAGAGAEEARRFRAACEEQFSAEGLHIEFSPTYHRLSLDMVVLGWALMRRRQPDEAAKLEPLVRRGVQACAMLANHGGELPVFSDNDSGMVVNFGQSARRFGAYGWLPMAENPAAGRPRHLASPAEAVFGSLLAGLAGEAGPEEATQGDSGPALGTHSVPPFAVLESGRDKLVLRAGKLGLAGRASHDHDDALSFWYSAGGRDWIVEAGCPPYTRDRGERAYAIASSSHNLVLADGRERFAGATGSVTLTLRGGPEGRFRFEDQELCAELVAGPGVGEEMEPRAHRRSFSFRREGELLLSETVQWGAASRYASFLHFHPRLPESAFDISPGKVKVTEPGAQLTLEVLGPVDGIELEPYTCHLDYGASTQAWRLRLHGSAAGDTQLELAIRHQEVDPC